MKLYFTHVASARPSPSTAAFGRAAPSRSTTAAKRQLHQPRSTARATAILTIGSFGLRMNLARPEKLVSRNRVDRYRDNEQRELSDRQLLRSIAADQKKHPRQQNGRVTI